MRWLTLLVALSLCSCVLLNPPGDRKEAARTNTDLGLEYMNQGQDDRALKKLEKAIQQDPTLGSAHAAIALLYTKLEDYEKADRHYQKALFYEPGNATFNNNYGAYLCSRGQIDKGVVYFRKVLSDPTYPAPENAHTNAGMCLRQKPDLKSAEEHFRKALERNPQYSQALGQMAMLSYQQQDYMKARAFLQRYESTTRATPDMLLLGMRIEKQLGNDAAYASYAERLRNTYPGATPNAPYAEALD